MQFLFLRAIKSHVVFLLTGMILFTISCEDTDDDHDHDDEGHTDAEGFVLEDENETEFCREFDGAIVTNNLSLAVGEELELSVHFLDHDGEEIEHDDHDDEHTTEESELRVTVVDPSVATVEVEGHDEEEGDEHEHEEEHGMAIHVTGVSAGQTSFTLELMHGDHADYTSTNNVPVTVTASN